MNTLYVLENLSQFEDNSVLCSLKIFKLQNKHETVRSSCI